MEQAWNSFFLGVRHAMDAIALPFIDAARAVGIELVAAQVWMLFFTLLFLAYAVRFFFGEAALNRRGRRAVGTVIGIDPGDEAPDRPIIEFTDHLGRTVVFTSYLGVNDTTRGVGSSVEIVFDPHRPSRAREVGRPLGKTYHYLFLVFFVCFMALGTVLAKDAIY